MSLPTFKSWFRLDALMRKNRRPHFNNRRRVFRVRLPDDALLNARINGRDYELIEVSEFGLVVTCNEVENVDGQCTGVVRWLDGRSTEFTGEIGRRSELGRVIWKVHGISMSDIVQAQRQLILRYPMRRMLGKAS